MPRGLLALSWSKTLTFPVNERDYIHSTEISNKPFPLTEAPDFAHYQRNKHIRLVRNEGSTSRKFYNILGSGLGELIGLHVTPAKIRTPITTIFLEYSILTLVALLPILILLKAGSKNSAERKLRARAAQAKA